MEHTQFPGQAGRAAKRGIAVCAVLAMAAGSMFTTASMADSSGMAAYAPISNFGGVGPYGQSLSGENQKWLAPTFGSGTSSQGGNGQTALATQALDSSALARNIQVGLNAGTIAVITAGGAGSLISSAGNSSTSSQSSNVVLVGK